MLIFADNKLSNIVNMKKTLLSILMLFCATFASAQEIVLGDMDGDGKVTVVDVTEVVSTVTGKSAIKKVSGNTLVNPNAPDTELLAGAWRSITGEKITLNSDGSATHSNMQTVKTYEYYPYGRMLVLLNSGGYVVEVYDVIRTSENFVVMCVHGTNNYVCYYSNDSYASGITLSSTNLALNTGESKQLTVTSTPPNTVTPLLTWSSSNTNVATVDQNGKVTAVGNGSCVITAKANDASGLTADCSVTVTQLVTCITLSSKTLCLDVDDYTKLTATVTPADAKDKSVIWSSSNDNVAEINNKGIVYANGYGKCDIICTASDGSGVSAVCKVIVEKPHEYVDLGLPSGLKWATFNVGANSPEEYGDYFAWGETEPYYTEGHSQDRPCSNWRTNKTAGYDWPSYNWCNGSYDSQTKYCTSSSYGTVDNKTVLDLEDDAAHVNWGGDWRMPTKEEQDELRTKCTWTWELKNGVNGYTVVGPNGNSLFLPAAGYRIGSNLYNVGIWGPYWSSSRYLFNSDTACYLGFESDLVYSTNISRYCGFAVRPVCQ